MTLIWDGEAIQSYDLDREIPGPRAEEIASLLEPGYLRGYLESRRKEVSFREARRKGKPGRGFRQIQRLLRSPGGEEKQAAPWQYATFLREMLLAFQPGVMTQQLNPVRGCS